MFVCLKDPKDMTPVLKLEKVTKLRRFLKRTFCIFHYGHVDLLLFPLPIYHPLSSALDRCEMIAPISRSYCPSIQRYFYYFSFCLSSHPPDSILKTPHFPQAFHPQNESDCGFTPQRYPVRTWQS